MKEKAKGWQAFFSDLLWHMRFLRLIAMGLYILAAMPLGFAISLCIPLGYLKTFLLGRLIGSGTLKVAGFRLEIENKKYLGQHYPCLYIANHQSNLDLFIAAAVVPKKTISIGKKSIGWIPLFGQLYLLAGNFLIDRRHHRKGVATMSALAQKIVRDSLGLWMFPEGTRSRDRRLLPFKKGAFHTAVQAGCPIVPVIIEPYRTDFSHWKARPLRLKVLPPIPTEKLGEDGISPLRESCFTIFERELAAMRNT